MVRARGGRAGPHPPEQVCAGPLSGDPGAFSSLACTAVFWDWLRWLCLQRPGCRGAFGRVRKVELRAQCGRRRETEQRKVGRLGENTSGKSCPGLEEPTEPERSALSCAGRRRAGARSFIRQVFLECRAVLGPMTPWEQQEKFMCLNGTWGR